jgi:hypothetical protein
MIRLIQIHKTRWLLTVDNLIKVAMEKSILDIKMTNRPGAGDVKVENQANHGRLDNRTEGLIIVNYGMLRESTNNPTSFIARESPIRVEFMPKNRPPSQDVHPRRSRN